MTRFMATALAATLALGTIAAPALADGHGNGKEKHSERGHRTAVTQNHRGNHGGDNDDEDQYGNQNGNNRGPHACVNPAGHTRGWCRNGNGNGNYNGYPNGNGNGGYANQQVSGIVTAVSGNRITILVGLRSINIDATQAFRNGQANNVGIGSNITAYGSYGNDNTFYATRIN